MAESLDIGVVVPLYNKKDSVRQSVLRLLNQTVRPAQVVVVDDGSTDGSAEELASLAEGITIVRQANAGPSAARNRGLALLETEWVGFADADNLWDWRRLERVRDFLEGHPGVDWLTGRYWRCFPDGKREPLPPWTGPDGVFAYIERAGHLPGLHCSETLIARRALVQEIGGFNEKLRCFEITLMYLQLGLRRPRIGFLAEPTAEVFCDLPSSLFAQHLHSPPALLAYAEEMLALYRRAPQPPAFLAQSISQTLQDCAYEACHAGTYTLARQVLAQHGHWLRPRVRWNARLRCILARLRGR